MLLVRIGDHEVPYSGLDCLNAKSGRSTRCYKKLNSAPKLIQRTTSEAPQRLSIQTTREPSTECGNWL
jgi:hypothetical protein